MSRTIQNIAVIGDGQWGTTLAIGLVKNGYPVKLWGPFPEYIRKIQKNRYNSKFLPGIRLPDGLQCVDKLEEAIDNSKFIVFAVPSKFTPDVLIKIKKLKINLSDKIILSVTKGIDNTTLQRMSEIIKDQLDHVTVAVLSGPTIAIEVAKGLASTAVIATKDIKLAKKLQAIFNSEYFRIYTNSDVIGVELGGSIKNIIAVACGICDGLGLGTNTKAAILTRGLAEMARLGKALGAKQKTFSGLSGLGDLATTCFSPKSRNRCVGEKIGKGQSVKAILGAMDMVAEGIETVKGAYKLSRKYKVSMPITEEVYNIVYNKKDPSQAVMDLMTRKMKSE